METKTAKIKKETGIIFGAESIKGILEGQKTQTRRLRNLKFVNESPNDWSFSGISADGCAVFWNKKTIGTYTRVKCPYGKVGDLLWIKEDFCCIPESDGGILFDLVYTDGEQKKPDCALAAEWESRNSLARYKAKKSAWITFRKHPQFFMPRWASRLTLEITNIRVERLQDISEADALAEGGWKYSNCPFHKNPEKSFADVWDKINGKREGCSWSDNPFVWVIEFKKV